MKRVRYYLLHPISVFVVAQIAWGLLMFIWIRWYVLRSREIDRMLKNLPLGENWKSGGTVILLQGCILMGIILIVFYLIFVSLRKQIALNNMQRSILDSVTHELKTPLAAIRLNTETLLVRKLPEESRIKFLQKSVNEILRLQHLIDGILLSAQLEAGKTTLEQNYINIVDVFLDSWKSVQERMGDKRNFTLDNQLNSSDKRFQFNFNEQQMSLLFDNLLGNATKYTSAGGEIKVNISGNDEVIQFSITDNGVGIEKTDLKKIFRKFFRASNQKTKRVSGSGLGLFVCESVVKAHKGKIFATSEGLNKGATFYVEFKRDYSINRR